MRPFRALADRWSLARRIVTHRASIFLERLQLKREVPAAPPRVFPVDAERRLLSFYGDAPLCEEDYEQLFLYFLEGWETYRSEDAASATYPGLPSSAGTWTDRVEGASRFFPLLGAWMASGRTPEVKLGDAVLDLPTLLQRGLLAGTDPRSPSYWGPIRDFSKRIVEAADIALSLWLSRESVWHEFTNLQKEQVLAWLAQVSGRRVHDNNWHLFVVLVNQIIQALGGRMDAECSRLHYERFKSFYRGDGWFSDGPGRRFDYYNAWAIHYSLFWLREIEPSFDHTFLHPVQGEFLGRYKYLIGPSGFPILGRSVCYRLAAPAPLIMGYRHYTERVSAAEARRSLDVIWRYFVRCGAVRDGTVTQGYCGETDPRILDNYSGPASCLWSLRSLVAALYLPPESPFWQGPAEALPVETGDYVIEIPATGWRVRAQRERHLITIQNLRAASGEQPLARHGRLRRIIGGIIGPVRPSNAAAKYRRAEYRSDPPFFAPLEGSDGEGRRFDRKTSGG